MYQRKMARHLVTTALLCFLVLGALTRGQEEDDDETGCPAECTCGQGAVSDLVVQCTGYQSHQANSMLPRLSQQIEGVVTRLDITGSRIPILIDDFLSNERFYSKSLNSLRLSSSSIEKINPRAFKSAKNLVEIDLDGNDLSFIPNEVFSSSSCPKLKLVSLSHNANLKFPDNGPFLKSHSIAELDVSYCGITEIHMHSLSKLTKLVFLNLANNNVELIHPEAFSKLNYLEDLDLSSNQIINLPSKLPSTLQNLNLRNNPKFNVSTLIDLAPNVAISDLDLSQCNIQTIPRDMFSRLHDLMSLNLSHNAITNLYFPFVLRKLQYLDLSHNSLSGEIDADLLGSCTSLETLRLGWNSGLQLPESGFKGDLSSMYLLDISGCDMEVLMPSSIESLTGLTYLNISNNALQSLAKNVFVSFPALNTLDISNNQLNFIPNSIFKENIKLKRLSIASNTNLSPILNEKVLENNLLLKSLDISDCDFTDMPAYLPEGLEILIANNNKFRDSVKLTKLIEHSLLFLRTISITENPWKCNFEFKQLIALLRDRQIIDEGNNGTWSGYQQYVCLADKITDEMLRTASLRPREVLKSHFWSLLTFSLTLMSFVVIAVVITVACKGRVSRGLSRSYHQLDSETSSTSSSPAATPAVSSKIFREPPQTSEKPTTFTTNFLFPRFPVTQSEIPTSYVSGNYHHAELVP